MDWENENYVRVYTRDTADLLAIGWEGRAVLWELERKCDRAGVIDSADPAIVCELLRMPRELVEVGLTRLADRGVIKNRAGFIFIRNFMAAQEASKSSKQRQRECRERRRDQARVEQMVTDCDDDVTVRDELVTERDENVTDGHTESHPVTSGHSLLCVATPSNATHSPAAEPDFPPDAKGQPTKPTFDFDAVYQFYPRKQGKKAGMAKVKKLVTSEWDYAALLAAVETMAKAWDGHDLKFCPHWSTFVNGERWRDDALPLPSEEPAKHEPSTSLPMYEPPEEIPEDERPTPEQVREIMRGPLT